LKIAYRARASTELSDRVTSKFIPPQLWPLNLSDLNPVDYSVWEYGERRCTKHASLIWTYRRCHWRIAAAMTMIRLGHQSLFQFVEISDEYFEHLLLQYFPHSVINWIQICGIWRPQIRWKKFWIIFL